MTVLAGHYGGGSMRSLRSFWVALFATLTVSGALEAPSSYFKKSPPIQYFDDEARNMTEEFIRKYALKSAKAAPSKRPAAKTARKKTSKRTSKK